MKHLSVEPKMCAPKTTKHDAPPEIIMGKNLNSSRYKLSKEDLLKSYNSYKHYLGDVKATNVKRRNDDEILHKKPAQPKTKPGKVGGHRRHFELPGFSKLCSKPQRTFAEPDETFAPGRQLPYIRSQGNHFETGKRVLSRGKLALNDEADLSGGPNVHNFGRGGEI
jgi:hypothetical protein